MPDGLLLSDDLMFTSRITGTAQAQGLTVKPVRSVEALLALIPQEKPGGIVLDLNHPELDIAALMARLPEPRPRVIGFGSHVDAATLKAARQAGCDEVMPRSQFVERLPERIAEWVQPSS